MYNTKKELFARPVSRKAIKFRIQTLKNMHDRYGRVTIHDVQLVTGGIDSGPDILFAISNGWTSTRFFVPVYLKDGWYLMMPNPKNFTKGCVL